MSIKVVTLISLCSSYLGWSSMPKCVMSKCVTSVGVMPIQHFLRHVYSTWLFIFKVCMVCCFVIIPRVFFFFMCIEFSNVYEKWWSGPKLASYRDSSYDRISNQNVVLNTQYLSVVCLREINASIVCGNAGLACQLPKKRVLSLLFQWAHCRKHGSPGRKSHACKTHDYIYSVIADILS